MPEDQSLFTPGRVGVLLATLICAALVTMNFAPDINAVNVKAFGSEPFGVRVGIVVSAIETVLYLPYFWVFKHLGMLVHQAMTEGKGGGLLRFLTYVLTVRQRHPGMATSQVIVLGGLIYFVVLMAAWITYAAWLDI